jgi:alanine racemase
MGVGMLQVDLAAIRSNYQTILRSYPHAKVCLVLKADGYGFGLPSILPAFTDPEPQQVAVLDMDEAVTVRNALPSTRIQLLNPLAPNRIRAALVAKLEPMVETFEQIHDLQVIARALCLRASVHVKVDLGLGRFGFHPNDANAAIALIGQHQSLQIATIYVHGPRTRDWDPPELRLQTPRLCAMSVEHSGVTSQTIADRVGRIRFGVAVFGLLRNHPDASLFSPVIKLTCRVIKTRRVSVGEPLGYDGKIQKANALCAILDIGYAHGLPYSNPMMLSATIRGHRLPLLGPPLMNHSFAIGASDLAIEVGDQAVLTSTCGETGCDCSPCPVRHLPAPPKVSAMMLLNGARATNTLCVVGARGGREVRRALNARHP